VSGSCGHVYNGKWEPPHIESDWHQPDDEPLITQANATVVIAHELRSLRRLVTLIVTGGITDSSERILSEKRGVLDSLERLGDMLEDDDGSSVLKRMANQSEDE